MRRGRAKKLSSALCVKPSVYPTAKLNGLNTLLLRHPEEIKPVVPSQHWAAGSIKTTSNGYFVVIIFETAYELLWLPVDAPATAKLRSALLLS